MNWEVRTMRSGTSFFNSTLYRKNMTRFWPIWAVYGVIWAFAMPLQLITILGQYASNAEFLFSHLARQAQEPVYMLESGVVISAVFGLAAAMAVFSYLFFGRSAYMMHSLPLDRNTLFVTNYLSGLSFLVLPNLAIALMTAAVEAVLGCLNLHALFTWLIVQSATALFFYSFAVFCAMFTGHLLALPAFYAILNFLVYVILSLLGAVLTVLLYGFDGFRGGIETIAEWLTPFTKLVAACSYAYVMSDNGDWVRTAQLRDPGVVAVYAVVAVVLTLAALWVYHKRHVESAGDVVAIPLVRPVFKYGVALCAGLCFGVFTSAILSLESELFLSVFSVIWAIIGYFVAEMLLRKSFRVFKAWKGAVVLAALLSLVFASAALDWFGYEDRVPDPADVTQVHLHSTSMGVPYDSAHYGNALILTDPDQIRLVTDLHRGFVTEKDRHDHPGEEYISAYLEYTLADGSTLVRRYSSAPINLDEEKIEGSLANAAAELISDRELVREMYGFDEILAEKNARLVRVELERFWDGKDEKYSNLYLDNATNNQLIQLWKAVLLDFEEGNIGTRYLFDHSPQREENTYTADLIFLWDFPAESDAKETLLGVPKVEASTMVSYSMDLSITLTPQARHTLECLEEIADFDLDGLHTYYEYRNRD